MSLQIKQLRVRKGLKQGEIAKLLGMPTRRYGSYEREERALSLVDAARIADVLDCTLDELAGREFPKSAASALTTDERQLVDLYRGTDERGKRSIVGNALQQQDEFERGGTEKPRRNEGGVA